MRTTVILIFVLSIIACDQKGSSENLNLEGKITEVIKTKLNRVYTMDLKDEDALNDTLLFSKEIIILNYRCDSLTKVSSELISKSSSPSDKPILREGSLISSLYEGVTDFKIDKIKDNGEAIEAFVTLSNKFYKDQKPWKEKIIFINEGSLKIDNIYFDPNLYTSGLKEVSLKESLVTFSGQIIKTD